MTRLLYEALVSSGRNFYRVTTRQGTGPLKCTGWPTRSASSRTAPSLQPIPYGR
jgi:hypothetical protein